MWPDFGDDTPFVWAAFALSFSLLVLLTIVTVFRARSARQRLDQVRATLDEAKASRKASAAKTDGESR